jgi:hypothetical protein
MQFERIAKNTLTTSAEFSATIAFAFVGGVAISGAKLALPTLRSVYYGYAHHMQKVLDFIFNIQNIQIATNNSIDPTIYF